MALYFIFSLVYVLVILCLWFCLWYLIRHSHYPSPLALPVPSPITTTSTLHLLALFRSHVHIHIHIHTHPHTHSHYICIASHSRTFLSSIFQFPLCLYAAAAHSYSPSPGLPLPCLCYCPYTPSRLTTPVSLMCTVSCHPPSRPLFASFCLVPRSRYPRSFSVHAIFRLASLHLAPLCLARDVLYIFLSISAALGYPVALTFLMSRCLAGGGLVRRWGL